VRVLRLPHSGKGGALRAGMTAARGEIRAFTDADLPYGLDLLPLAMEWTRVTGGIYDTQCGFKVFRGDVAAELFRVARVDGFAIDVEVIYLLLKYRLDVKRIPVRLERNAPSSVHVLRDSVASVRDIASI